MPRNSIKTFLTVLPTKGNEIILATTLKFSLQPALKMSQKSIVSQSFTSHKCSSTTRYVFLILRQSFEDFLNHEIFLPTESLSGTQLRCICGEVGVEQPEPSPLCTTYPPL